MKKIFVWILLMTKRQLKRASTVVILVCMLLTIMAMRAIPTSISGSIPVGYCIDRECAEYDELTQMLSAHQGSLWFQFYDDEAKLEQDVISGTIQAGYAFPDDLDDIVAYRPSDSATSMLSDVVILAVVMELTADDMLLDNVLDQSFAEGMTDQDIEYIKSTYLKYQTNDSTFAFDYKTLYDDYEGSSHSVDISSYIVTPVRGIIAIFIFVAALAAGVGSYTDESNQIYANIPLRRRPVLRLLNISIPAVLASIIGLTGIIIVGISSHVIYEIFALTVYTCMCALFCFLLSYVVNSHVYTALIPVFILGSVVCCPIIFNLGNIIPAMKVIQQLFLPTYYITIFF